MQQYSVPIIRFKQWLNDWDAVDFSAEQQRAKPSPDIYLFSMKAVELRALSEPFRRQRQSGVASGIQRHLDQTRADLIRDFVRFGYPYSEMSKARREAFHLDDLRKPGWLPTAIIVNILKPNDARRGRTVNAKDIVKVENHTADSRIILPDGFRTDGKWSYKALAPFEIIDGQHRLFAFDPTGTLPGNFELPVVAFHGLDLGWQAYLFWSINVSPKRINRSHAFDLYPLLRTQDWLEKFDEAIVYREARAQELTEVLYNHAESPWHQRINMLGETGKQRARVTQAGWIRSLTSSFLSTGRSKGSGGLFGANLGHLKGPLPWSRIQQAALLLCIWKDCEVAVGKTKSEWAKYLRSGAENQDGMQLGDRYDAAFHGAHSLLNQEQGVRGLLTVTNDLYFLSAEELGLDNWTMEKIHFEVDDQSAVTNALKSFRKQKYDALSKQLMESLSSFDWRSADAQSLTDEESRNKKAYRGSGGYAVLRDDLIKWLQRSKNSLKSKADQLAILYSR